MQSLGQLDDATRILQKFLLCKGRTFDLVAICVTIDVWKSIKTRLELEREMELRECGTLHDEGWASIHTILSKIDCLPGLVSRIRAAVLSDAMQDEKQADELEEAGEEDGAPFSKPGLKSPLNFQNWTIQPQYVQ